MGEMIKYGIKIAIAAASFAAVLFSISQFIALINIFTFGGVLGEVIDVIGCFLPVNASSFNLIWLALGGFISFLVANKIFNFISEFNRQT